MQQLQNTLPSLLMHQELVNSGPWQEFRYTMARQNGRQLDSRTQRHR